MSALSLAISPGTWRTWSWMRLRPFMTMASRVIWLVTISASGYVAGYLVAVPVIPVEVRVDHVADGLARDVTQLLDDHPGRRRLRVRVDDHHAIVVFDDGRVAVHLVRGRRHCGIDAVSHFLDVEPRISATGSLVPTTVHRDVSPFCRLASGLGAQPLSALRLALPACAEARRRDEPSANSPQLASTAIGAAPNRMTDQPVTS